MKYMFRIVALLVILLAACGTNDGQDAGLQKAEPIAVELTVPEHVDVNETVVMEAYVTQGEEEVNDADEVVFEVWEETLREKGEMIEASNATNGLYSAETSFPHDGLFHVQVHVTARDLHVMPQKEIIVGLGGTYENVEEAVFHTEGFQMHFNELTDVTIKEPLHLTTFIQLHDDPLTNLAVTYEIWREGEENRDWIDATEVNDGEYEAEHRFSEAGTYFIQVHVEDEDELHEHATYEIKVKDE